MENYLKNKKILITGSSGLVGTELKKKIIKLSKRIYCLDSKVDLRNYSLVEKKLKKIKPDIIFHLAAQVGGIWANKMFKYDFYHNNLLINTNLVHAAAINKVKYLIGMGTGSAYPKKFENRALHEKSFLSGEPDETNEGYAYAKRSLLIQMQILKKINKLEFCFYLPANLYGPNDNFSNKSSHVVPALIRRFFENKNKDISIWGNKNTKRDFLYIGDCVDAMIYGSNRKICGIYNISSGKFQKIEALVTVLKKISCHKGKIKFLNNNLVGQKVRKLSSKKLAEVGWKSQTSLEKGVKLTYEWFKNNQKKYRGKN